MAVGAPDWHYVVTLVHSLTTGAPDWERVIVGPGGTSIIPAGVIDVLAETTWSAAGIARPLTFLGGPVIANAMTLVVVELWCSAAGAGTVQAQIRFTDPGGTKTLSIGDVLSLGSTGNAVAVAFPVYDLLGDDIDIGATVAGIGGGATYRGHWELWGPYS